MPLTITDSKTGAADLTKILPPHGIKLDAGSTQRLVFCIKDNVGSTADSFNCIAYGFDRFA